MHTIPKASKVSTGRYRGHCRQHHSVEIASAAAKGHTVWIRYQGCFEPSQNSRRSSAKAVSASTIDARRLRRIRLLKARNSTLPKYAPRTNKRRLASGVQEEEPTRKPPMKR